MIPRSSSTALDPVMPLPHFTERHERMVHAPVDVVWAAALAVTPREIRLLAPFMALRTLPRLLRGGSRPSLGTDEAPFLEAFQEEGFVELHRDGTPRDGRARAVYGAAGRFWSLTDNAPAHLAGAGDFARHDVPGTARLAFSIEVDEHAGVTRLRTETRVMGTDPAARRSFRCYWMLIRGPSGLIRRSWLAAIERRARA